MLLTLPLFTDKADNSMFCCMLEEGSVSGLLQRSSNFTKAPSQDVEIQLIGRTLGTRADLRRGEALWNHHTITYLFCTTIILDNGCEDRPDPCTLWTNLFGACSLDRFFIDLHANPNILKSRPNHVYSCLMEFFTWKAHVQPSKRP
jgi:hypothetical protein